MTTEQSERHRLENVLDRTIDALARNGESVLSQAKEQGIPDRAEVIEWCERTKVLVLQQHDRFALRAELPTLADRLSKLIQSLPGDVAHPDEQVAAFIERLPAVRELLSEDIEAAFAGDPAAKNFAEILVSYPSIGAVATYRLAHELYLLGILLIPRIMTEHAHSETGIDIHPGARIGRSFFIDHGTGVVIGETCQIGDRVKLYQGVTLGALSFPRDENGDMIRGNKRHPTLEDDVTIYAGSTILGGDTTIGRGSTIGGNVWLTESTPAHSRVQIKPPAQLVRHGDEPAEERAAPLHWDI